MWRLSSRLTSRNTTDLLALWLRNESPTWKITKSLKWEPAFRYFTHKRIQALSVSCFLTHSFFLHEDYTYMCYQLRKVRLQARGLLPTRGAGKEEQWLSIF